MTIRKLINVLVLFIGFSSNAQPPLDWVSTSSLGGSLQDYVEDVFVDAAGNTYVCGTYSGSLNIGSTPLFAAGGSQAFIAKYDNTGTPLWAISSDGSLSNNQAFGKSIYVDNVGCVYVTGYHTHGILSFSGLSLPSSSSEGLFIVKLSPSGSPLHLTGPTFASTGKSQGCGIVGDGQFVYITGSHKGALTLPGGPTLPVPVGQADVFVAKVDSAFSAFSYAFSHGGTADDQATSIAMNGTTLFLTGYYGNATCTFNSTGPDYNLPAYGQDAIWLTACNKSNGDVQWSTSAGSANGPSRSNDVTLAGPSLYITGGCSDICAFNSSPSPTGPFTYNDTIYSNGNMDAFVARYNIAGAIQSKWNEGGTGEDEAFGITGDASCSQIDICGSFQNTVNFGGVTSLTANGTDMFVASFDNSGNLFWAFKEFCTGNDVAAAIHSNGTITSFGGAYGANVYFDTSPSTNVVWKGSSDHFISSFQCTSSPYCGPIITNCPGNTSVVATSTCTHTLTNYKTGLIITDGCSVGILDTVQIPALGTLSPGIHDIILTSSDVNGNQYECAFELTVLANVGPVVAECGDKFVSETTAGSANTFNSYACTGYTTSGEDVVYQVTVDAGTQYLQIKLDNMVDLNDQYAYIYWLGDTCVNTTTMCPVVDSFNVATNKFSNQSQYLTFNVSGPKTYYFVIDSKVDNIQSYDIEFLCAGSGIKFDGACGIAEDADSDGIAAFVDGSTNLTLQPCQSATICHDLRVKNSNWKWLDSVQFKLGDCYENISAILPANVPNNGFVDLNGEWSEVYDLPGNSITWTFAHSSGNKWGDGNLTNYTCQAYSFCFDADITSTCASSEGLNIGIVIADDGNKGNGPESSVFLVGNSNDFVLQDDDPTFTYPTNILCDGDPGVLPDNITSSGGTFTASVGIVFADGSPSPTGEIDLGASTIGGPYTITYTVGLCPFTHDFIVDILPQGDPAFNYSAGSYCQGDTDPVPTITGTAGGTFSGPAAIVFISAATGEIDLDASTAGGPYWVKYTTPLPNCVNTDSVMIIINAEDDPTFSYAATDYCAGDPNELPQSQATPGGTFDEYSGLLSVTSGGVVNIGSSTVGNYYITYTTPGICPNIDSVQFNVLPEDDPTFSYSATNFCQGDANPVASITGTSGGTFSGPAGITFVSTATGEIDLASSSAGGPNTITYTTPGPSCPNSSTFNVTINAEDDPAFSYPSNIICLADSNPVATITGTGGGTFSGTGGISFVSTTTGEIDITGTGVGGPYTITYTTPGPNCPNSQDVVVNIFNEDDPGISYSMSTFCSSDTDPVPTINTPGGTFSGPVSFIDVSTGEIDLDNSSPGGPFEVVYTSPGPECPNTDTAFIVIVQQDNASFDYGATQFCSTDAAVTPSINGTTGGFFSTQDTELAINSSTGQIDITSSTAGGPYDIKYATSNACPDSVTISVTIYEEPGADAGPDQTLFLNYTTSLAAVTPIAGTGTWSILSGTGTIADATDPMSTIADLEDGTTTLLWTVSNGSCQDATDEMVITISGLFIPDALTPNNDGLNDKFFIEGVDLIENNLAIYNRWGQVVYETSNYQNDWNGLDNTGKELAADTYFYILEVDQEKFKGYVVLKR